jgi:outer membrane protein OmpA-like peptidoglycan-associated protein
MLETDLREWEEYDTRLTDDFPTVLRPPAAPRSAGGFSEAPGESPGVLETPFLLGREAEPEAETIAEAETAPQTEGISHERGARRLMRGTPRFGSRRFRGRAAALSPGHDCDCGNSAGDPADTGTDEYGESEGLEELELNEQELEGQELELNEQGALAESFEVDPYALIRPALSREHASLPADEMTVVLGHLPASLVLHQLLHSPAMRQATMASILGKGARRSVRLHGASVSIPDYLRIVSRLCGEVAEQAEAESPGAGKVRRAACPPRDPDEKKKSFFVAPTVSFSGPNLELLIQRFPVGSHKVTAEMTGAPAWEEAMSFIAGDPNTKVFVTGETDCDGSQAENFKIQELRADAVKARMPALVQSRVLAALPAGTASFLTGNATAAERAANRAVQVKFTSAPPSGQGRFDRLVSGAKTLDEYLFLVRSLEQNLGLSAPPDTPKALSVLRQIYYGPASWTLQAGRNALWNRIISSTPWPPGNDPTAQLTPPLMKALQASQTTEGIDLGHVFAGLDAMMNPHPLSFQSFTSGLNNEEVATWLGDVASAAAPWAVDTFYGHTLDGKPVGSADDYFKRFAGNDDLLGDLDAYAIRAGFSPSSAPSSLVMSSIQLRGPLSDALLRYYRVSQSDQGQARKQRFKIFVESFGGVVSAGSLKDPQALIATLQPKVELCAAVFALKLLSEYEAKFGQRTSPPGDSRLLNQLVTDGSAKMTNRFVDFLVKGL